MRTIATLYQFKRHLVIPPDVTTDDDRLLTALQAATRHIERESGRRHLPYYASYTQDADPRHPSELLLTRDLLELESVTDAGGPVNLDDITIIPPGGPGALLQLNGYFLWDGSPHNAVTVTGVWGWHSAPLTMWQNTGDTVNQSTFADDDTQLSVSDADATYADGLTPRFSVGNLLQVGAEFMRVLAVDAATDTLTVERGAQGTTATTHLQGSPISVYRPPYDVLMTVLAVATWFYRAPDQSPAAPIPTEVVGAMLALRRAVVRV